MEAKDTVMNENRMIVLLGRGAEVTPTRAAKVLCEAQAEISFKVGREEEHKVMIDLAVDEGNKAFKDGRQVGIKEVVEWLSARGMLAGVDNNLPEWQAKLKEWEK